MNGALPLTAPRCSVTQKPVTIQEVAMGRPPLGDAAMTPAERQRRHRAKRALGAVPRGRDADAKLVAHCQKLVVRMAVLESENARLRATLAKVIKQPNKERREHGK